MSEEDHKERLTGYTGVRLGEASNPGPFLKIHIGNVSSMLLHQEYLLKANTDVYCVTESRLTAHGQTEARQIWERKGWDKNCSEPQLPRRPNEPGRLNDAMPWRGGLAVAAKRDIPVFSLPLTDARWTEEDKRRCLFTVLAPAAGREPIHLVTVYGVAGAMDDAEKLRRNEEFLTKIFEATNAYGDVPVCVVGDLNTEPQHSAIISTQLGTGNWVDIAHAKAELNGQVAENTYNGPRRSSRIDLCLLNSAAAELFIDFDLVTDASCTVPNHKQLSLTMRISSTTQRVLRAHKPWRPHSCQPLPLEDRQGLALECIHQFVDEFDQAFYRKDTDAVWHAGCSMAESWCVQHAAIASGEHHNIEDSGAYGRGLCSLKYKTQHRRDYSEDCDLVPPQLQAANKIGRLLEELSCKLRDDARPEVRAEYVPLWDKICRIGFSDLHCAKFEPCWSVPCPTRSVIVDTIRKQMQTYVARIGAQRRQLRMKNQTKRRRQDIIRDLSRICKNLQG